MADMSAARKAAEEAKAAARAKIAAARREADERKALKKHPPKQYVTMPAATGDAEADSAADLDAIQAGFRSRAKDEASRKALATDTEYWVCLCFQTRAQKEAFLSSAGLLDLGDKYIDGREVASRLAVKIPDEKPPYHDVSKLDPSWVQLAMSDK